MKLLWVILLSGCASVQIPCIDYHERWSKYVRQYTRDEISVHEFVIFNENLDILQELGIKDCKIGD